MARWIRIESPDWGCEADTWCGRPATWEEDRTQEQISKRQLPALRCDEHLPSDAEKIEDDAEPTKKEAV